MVQVHFKSEERQNPKECFEQAIKRKMPKGRTEIKMGTSGWERRHTKGGTIVRKYNGRER
jgi:hypothetical protein